MRLLRTADIGLGTAVILILAIMLIPEKTEVTAQILSCGELTKYSPIAELKGHFTYAGEDVAHLWKLTVKLINSGDKTIVGEGNQKNIIGEGLNFVFPDDTRILNIEEEANTFQSTITQPEPNQIQIQFRQWRSGEYSITCFYVASDKPLDADPLPTTRGIQNPRRIFPAGRQHRYMKSARNRLQRLTPGLRAHCYRSSD